MVGVVVYDECPDCEGRKDVRSALCQSCRIAANRVSARYFTENAPDHPLADAWGRVYVHRRVLFDAGVEIPPGCDVHHVNGNTHDNRLENLEVLPHGEHSRLHVLARTPEQQAAFLASNGGAISGQRRRERTTHCLRGHPYNEENTYEWNGSRTCRACCRERARMRREMLRGLDRPICASRLCLRRPYDDEEGGDGSF